MMTASHLRDTVARARDEDRGLGLMDVVVAMFVLSLLALSLLPLLITGMQTSVANATTAAASQFANDRINMAIAAGQTSANPCSVISTLADAPATMIDARGVELEAVTTVGACPTGTDAGTIRVATAVTRLDTGVVIARASTEILVLP